ncbi:type B DNA-directed DNA polymerase [Ferroplasma sp.]|uniref:type B DNA-directed DNA polymerase n=1 Tax=Ferroplasma sp. TaxID=2591003 RepID=UPI00307D9489
MENIINATGSDLIELWFYRSNKIVKKTFKNRTWIFVSGDAYYLTMLEKSLDATNYIYRYASMDDIYGMHRGIQIYLKPSKSMDLAFRIENSFGYRLKIYNADINSTLRFMESNGFEFFKLMNIYDEDINLPTAAIEPVFSGKIMKYVIINGLKCSGNAYEEVYEAIKNNVVIVYKNYSNQFSLFLEEMKKYGYYIKSKFYRERTFESYGRHSYMPSTVRIKDKICIDSDSFVYNESGIAGLFEMSRVSSLPVETVSYITPGTVVSAIEEKEALKRKILIPFRKDDYEVPKNPQEFFNANRGGIVFNPDPGVYENVYEIDFSSMYPGIIVNYRVSPENISGKNTAFLSMFLRKLLNRRLFYKALSSRGDIYSKRNKALKILLLNSFGYTGYKNAKFGRIDVHEKITEIGRKIIEISMRIAENNGFHVMHGVVDSLWLSGPGDIKKTLKEICKNTGIQIVLDSSYKWIAFLPQNNGTGSANRYIGLRNDGTFKIRGIELRRRDSPALVKKFQDHALNILNCDFMELRSRKYMIEKLKDEYKKMENFDIEDFRIEFGVSRHINDYKSKNIIYYLMKNQDYKNTVPGMVISGIIMDKEHNIVKSNSEFFDKKYYEKRLERSFKPFDFIISNSGDKITEFH